jgi:hypothetical protein
LRAPEIGEANNNIILVQYNQLPIEGGFLSTHIGGPSGGAKSVVIEKDRLFLSFYKQLVDMAQSYG